MGEYINARSQQFRLQVTNITPIICVVAAKEPQPLFAHFCDFFPLSRNLSCHKGLCKYATYMKVCVRVPRRLVIWLRHRNWPC